MTKTEFLKKMLSNFFQLIGIFMIELILVFWIIHSYYPTEMTRTISNSLWVGFNYFIIDYYSDQISEINRNEEFNEIISPEIERINIICEGNKRCLAEKSMWLLTNDTFVLDFDDSKTIDCEDYAVAYCYIMSKFHIKCRFILTKNHIVNLIRIDSEWIMVDAGNSQFDDAIIKDYIVGKI